MTAATIEPTAARDARTRGSVPRLTGGHVPDCGLYVHDAEMQVIRQARVSVPDVLDQPTLELLHKECIQGLPALFARLVEGTRTRAIFLHAHAVPDHAVITASRRRSPGRWLTATTRLGAGAGGRGIVGPEIFFRQVDIDRERAWLSPLIVGMASRQGSRQVRVPGEPAEGMGSPELWTWEVRGERFFYREHGGRWRLYGAGNTPLLRLEQAVHLADPQTFDDYLWAVGAIVLGEYPSRQTRRRRRGSPG